MQVFSQRQGILSEVAISKLHYYFFEKKSEAIKSRSVRLGWEVTTGSQFVEIQNAILPRAGICFRRPPNYGKLKSPLGKGYDVTSKREEFIGNNFLDKG